MTNQEQIKVARAMGWTNVRNRYAGRGALEGSLIAWVGTDPYGRAERVVPNWPEDLPACMAPGGPWEWLKQSCSRKPSLHVEEDGTAWVIAFIKPADRDYYMGNDEVLVKGADEALALCHAVLAVKEKLHDP